MYDTADVTTSPEFPLPARMRAWVLGDPDQLHLRDKPVPVSITVILAPGRTAPEGSVTVPTMLPWPCANEALLGHRRTEQNIE